MKKQIWMKEWKKVGIEKSDYERNIFIALIVSIGYNEIVSYFCGELC